MKVGVLKEIKTKENRVAMTPAGVEQMVVHGHTVMVETTAGEGSGFSDEAYVKGWCPDRTFSPGDLREK